MTQKRTCERCKCSDILRYEGWTCLIGYKVDSTHGKPLEACPKPLTNLQRCRTPYKPVQP